MAYRALLFILLLGTALCLTNDVASARSFWTDANGDGLPNQGGPGTPIAADDTISVDLWIDSEDLVWEDCRLIIGWSQVLRQAGAGFYLEGGANLFWLVSDDTLGFMGFNYAESGVDRIGWLKLRREEAGECCVEPIIGEERFGLSSRLLFENVHYYFSDRDVSCFASPVPNATETRTWGQVKALYR